MREIRHRVEPGDTTQPANEFERGGGVRAHVKRPWPGSRRRCWSHRSRLGGVRRTRSRQTQELQRLAKLRHKPAHRAGSASLRLRQETALLGLAT
jgi:hypothetical protein